MSGFVTRQDLTDQLREHYLGAPTPSVPGVFLTNVQVVSDGSSTVDAVYLSLATTAAARRLEACLLAVTRAEFQRVAKRIRAGEIWQRYSSRLWIVVSDPDLAGDAGQLPAGWGLMCPQPRSNRFRELRRASVRQDPDVDMSLVVALARRMEALRVDQIEQAEKATADEWNARLLAERSQSVLASIPLTERRRLDTLTALERQTGIRVSDLGVIDPPEGAITVHQWVSAFRASVGLVQSRDAADKSLHDCIEAIAEAMRHASAAKQLADDAHASLAEIGRDSADTPDIDQV
jgi:hypothetical protein